MAPGGSSRLKRVLSPAPNDVPAEDIAPQGTTQTKRLRFATPVERPPGVRTRSMQIPTERANQDGAAETNNQDQPQEDDNGLDSPIGHDWSYQGDYDTYGVGEREEHLQRGEDENHEDQTQTGDKGKCCPFAFCCLATLIDLLLILNAIWYDPSSEVIYALLNICSSEIQSCLNDY
jgi:hypothetical protein